MKLPVIAALLLLLSQAVVADVATDAPEDLQECLVETAHAQEVLSFLAAAGVTGQATAQGVLYMGSPATMDHVGVPNVTTCRLDVNTASITNGNSTKCLNFLGDASSLGISICAQAASTMSSATYSNCGISASDPLASTHYCLKVTQSGKGQGTMTASSIELDPDSDIGTQYRCSGGFTTGTTGCGKTYPSHHALHSKTLTASHYMTSTTDATGTTAALFLGGTQVSVTVESKFVP